MKTIRKEEIRRLIDWYAREARDFPWRKDPHPYAVWVVEIMSQQTRMSAVLPFFDRFMKAFPTVQALAAASEPEVLALWAGLGYYSRARSLRAAAQEICSRFEGRFPASYEDWRSLPGVGPYTAAAVTAQCFGGNEPVWDGNVLRVWSRLIASESSREKAFQLEALKRLRELQTGENPSSFNQAWMELGALVCTPKAPRCEKCPLRDCCRAHLMGKEESFPPPKQKPRERAIDCQAWIIIRRDRAGQSEVYMRPRKSPDWFAGLWDFPSDLGGVMEPVRTLPERILTQANRARECGQIVIRHAITHHKIRLVGTVFEAGGPHRAQVQALRRGFPNGRWVALDGLFEVGGDKASLPLSTVARKLLRQWARRDELVRTSRVEGRIR